MNEDVVTGLLMLAAVVFVFYGYAVIVSMMPIPGVLQ
jgi:hypothetical protein